MRLEPVASAPPADPVRAVVDVRPIQEPERAPLTAWYLDQLLRAFAADPVDDEEFVLVSRALRADPAEALREAGLPVVASRRVPPTSRALRSAGLTLDSFLLRGAELGARGDHSRGGGHGRGRGLCRAGDNAADSHRELARPQAIFHTAGGAVPLASNVPVVATLLDLAPWELPEVYAASRAARFGHRVRARVLRDAARVIVCSRAVGEDARRRLHIDPENISVIPLAVDAEFVAAAQDTVRLAADRERLGLPARYLAFAGRYDARKDLRTLLRALALFRARGASVPHLVIALDIDFPDDHARVVRAVEASNLSSAVTITSVTGARQRAAVVSGSAAFVYPSLADATALPVLEAIAAGVPVISSTTGALPETVGSAGIVVEPRDPARMASALEAMWADGPLARQLRDHACRRAGPPQRTWADVARETRVAYARASQSGVPSEGSNNDATHSTFRRFALR